ncbi:MAG: Mobile element protein, partial [uncultured Gemmatimonadaceae bacterium]
CLIASWGSTSRRPPSTCTSVLTAPRSRCPTRPPACGASSGGSPRSRPRSSSPTRPGGSSGRSWTPCTP